MLDNNDQINVQGLSESDIVEMAVKHSLVYETVSGQVISPWTDDHDLREHLLGFARELLTKAPGR